MHGDEHKPVRGEATGLRSMREAMRESADVLKCAALAHDDHTDGDLSVLYRIQDLQAEAFRLRESLQDAVRHGDENFYRLLDLQDEVRGLQEEVRGLQEEVLQPRWSRSRSTWAAPARSRRGDPDARIDSLACELDAAHARDAAQQARHEAISRARSAELAQWQAYAGGLRGVVGDMLSSDSWRFTWVLRALSATLRRRKSTGPALPDPPPPASIGHDGG